jgi:hypothetical protein
MAKTAGTSPNAHEAILKQLKSQYMEVDGLHRMEYPGTPKLGLYQPDFIWYVKSHDNEWQIALIGEVEASDFCGKDIPGACLLADHLCSRHPSTMQPTLVFVLPDNASQSDVSHVEERLNLAAAAMKKLTILPSMKGTEFLDWFKKRCTDYVLAQERPPTDPTSY